MKRKMHYINQPLRIVVLLVCGLVFMVSACKGPKPEEKAKKIEATAEEGQNEHEGEGSHEEENIVEISPKQLEAAGIETGKTELRSLSNTVKVNGVIDVPPSKQVSVSVPMGGFVRKNDLLEGMKVKKGQLLTILENLDYVSLQQEYLQNKNKLEYMEKEYQRQQELSRENISAVKIFQQTKAEYLNLKTAEKALKEKLAVIGVDADKLSENSISRFIKIYAPVNGYVSAINMNLGKFVKDNEVLFELLDLDHMHAELTVYEKDLPRLKPGQKVRFTVPNNPGKDYTASVYLIGRKISADRSVNVHAHLDQKGSGLIPGMYIQAVIETGASKVNSLPDEAVVQFEGNHYVFIDEGEKVENGEKVRVFEMTPVQPGISENGFTEVVLPSPINPAEVTIVTKGAFTLLSKMKNSEGEHHH